MSALIRYLEQVNHLKVLPRTGWLLAGVRPCESVADHTCAVALLAMTLAATIDAGWAEEGLERPLDTGRVLALALVHDLAEAMLTDLPRRSAELVGRETKRAAETTALAAIVAEVPGGDAMAALGQEYADAATPEARLVRDADKLEMVHQALVYAQAGHRTLDEFWEGHRWHFAATACLYEELVTHRR
jgi:putative hydrolase of HD superfamily